MKNDYKKLGKIIKEVRENREISMRKLAQNIGVSHSEISRIESGERQVPNLITIIALCEELQIDFANLLKETGFLDYNSKKVYEVTVQKILSKKIKVNAKDEEKAMDLISEFIEDNEIETLNPEEIYSFEAEKIADNDEEFLEEGQELLAEEFEDDEDFEDELDDLEECNSCEFYCPICGECTYGE